MLSFVPFVPSSRSWRCVVLLYKSPSARIYSRTPSAARQPGPDALRSSAEQTAHRRGPLSQFARALFRVHAGFEAALQAPMIQKSVRFGKEAAMQTGEIGGAKCGRFFDLGAVYRGAENVGQPLHGPIRNGHAAVDAQRIHHACARAPIVLHGG